MCSKRHHSPHQQYVFVILKFPPSKYFPSPAICTCHVKFPLSRYSKFPLSRYGTASHQQYALVILKFPLSKYISPAICTCHVKIPTKYFPSPAICTCHFKIPTKYLSPAIYNCHVKILIKYMCSHLWPYLAAIYTSQMRSDHRRRLRSICQTGYAPVCPRTTGCCHTPHIALTSSCWHPEKKKEKNHYAISNVYFF